MKWFTKKITMPENNLTKEVDAIQLWEVRWWSIHPLFDRKGADYEYDNIVTRQNIEAFPTQEEAEAFVTALRNAFALTKRTFRTKVEAVRTR